MKIRTHLFIMSMVFLAISVTAAVLGSSDGVWAMLICAVVLLAATEIVDAIDGKQVIVVIQHDGEVVES